MKLAAMTLALAATLAASIASAQPRPAVVPVAQPTAPVVPGAFVHLEETDPRGTVQALSMGGWTTVCYAPCDQPLDPRFEYRVGGRGVRPTPTFRVPAQGRLVLDADIAPTKNLIVGGVLTGVGGLFVVTGGLELLLGALYRAVASNERDPYTASGLRSGADVLSVVGVVFLVAGVGTLIPGIVTLGRGTRSSLHADADPPRASWLPKLTLVPGGVAF